MKYRFLISSFLVFPLSLLCVISYAQTNSSPYSALGIGDINSNNFDRTSGMGNTGISLSSGRYLMGANPAAAASLDNNYFVGEVAANFKGVYYSGGVMRKADGSVVNSKDIQFQKLNFGVKPTKIWGMTFGLKQFSSINYRDSSDTKVNGYELYIPTVRTGTGGLNQFFWTNAVKIGNHFSAGVDASYIFGSKQEIKTYMSNALTDQLSVPLTTYYNHLYFKGGVQYQGKLTNTLQLGLGVTAANKTTLNGRRSLDLISGNPATGAITSTLINDSTLGSASYTLPLSIGGGISLKYKNKYTWALDYQAQDWNAAGNTPYMGAYTINSSRWSTGIEIANLKTEIAAGNLYRYEKSFFQLGAYYNKGYMALRGQQINDMGFTVGVGFNPQVSATNIGSQLGYLINLSVGSRGTTKNALIKENYFQIGVILSYRDFWRSSKRGIYN